MTDIPNQKSPKKNRFLRRILRVSLVFLGLLMVLVLALRIPLVQKQLTSQLANSLTHDLGFEVSVGGVNFNFINKLEITDLLILYDTGDTLLYANKFYGTTHKPLTSLLNRRLEINEIQLDGAQLNLYQGPEMPDDFWRHFHEQTDLEQIKEENKEYRYSVFSLSLDVLRARNTKILNENLFSGKRQTIQARDIFLTSNDIDLPSNRFDLKSLVVDEFQVELEQFSEWTRDGVKWVTDTVKSSPPEGKFQLEMDLTLEFLEIRNGTFRNQNELKKSSNFNGNPFVNLNDLLLEDINVQMADIVLNNNGISASPKDLKFRTPEGFEILDFQSEQVFFSDSTIYLSGLQMTTGESYLDDDLRFVFDDLTAFSDFANRVEIGADFSQTEVNLGELLFFVPDLYSNDFFAQNREKSINLNGNFEGSINNFRGEDIDISIGDNFSLVGEFSSRNLGIEGSELLRLKISKLESNINALRNLIPGFEAPANFFKLGDISFEGRFDGYFRDFVAEGKLDTELGKARTDMRLDLKNGVDFAAYSGTIEVNDFDLAAWTGNQDFGKVDFFAEVDEGRGLTADFVNVHLFAEVRFFSYKNYSYENLQMDGFADRNVFDGFFSIQDENLDFDLVGVVFYGDKSPRVNAEIQLNQLNTKGLNLTSREFELSGNMSANALGIDLRYPAGSIEVNNFKISIPDSLETGIESLSLIAKAPPGESKELILRSDVVDIDLKGNYFFDEIPSVFLNYFHESFTYGDMLIGDSIETEKPIADFSYDIVIHDSKGFGQLIRPGLDTISNARIWGHVNSIQDHYKMEVSVPSVAIDNTRAAQIYGFINYNESIGNALFTAEEIHLGNFSIVNPSTAFLDFGRDTLGFSFNTSDYSEILDRFQVEGKAYAIDDKWGLYFSNSELTFFGEDWRVMPRNQLIYGNGFLRTKNLRFYADENEINVETINDRGVNFSLQGVNVSFLNELINDDRYLMSGNLNAHFWAIDIFELEALNSELEVQDFVFQDMDYGNLSVEGNLPTGGAPLNLNLRLEHPDRGLKGGGLIYLNESLIPEGKMGIDLDFEIRSFPMMIFQNIIEDGVRNTVGTFGGDLKVFGDQFSEVEFEGEATVQNAALDVDILGVRYFMDDQRVKIGTRLFDFTDVIFTDSEGNEARIDGGLTHNRLANMGMDLVISSPRILALNTDRSDNNLYYGRVFGQVDAGFTGSFKRPDIRVNAINGDGSNFFILLDETVESGDIDFVSFTEQSDEIEREYFSDVTGVNFQLDITLTEDAEVQIIFNEQTSDILRGSGNGNLQLGLSRNGDFSIFGDYEISGGKYLFSNAFGLLQINKPFDVLQGGTIQWTGDPLNAIIDIRANYSGLNAAPYNLIEDYLQSTGDGSQIINEARQSTPVDLTMLLTGYLINPEINFTINFPALTGQLRTLADRKILELEENQDEMNRQVFALVVIGGFLPSSFNIGTSVAAITNTVNEWLSNQLSLYLSDLLSDAFEDVGFISGIEMDVGYVLPTGEFIQQGVIDTRQSEVRIGLRPSLFDDRVQLNVGGNYVRESYLTSDPYLAPFGVIEYFITPDRRWRLRMSTNFDYVVEGRRNRHSIGVSFRREFDSIDEFMHTISLFEKNDKNKDKGREENAPEIDGDSL